MKVKKIEFDVPSGSAYLYFEEIKEGQAYRQIEIPGGIILDLAKDWRILGIEILNPALAEGFRDEKVAHDLESAHIPLFVHD